MLRVEVKEGSNKINVRHIFHVVKDPTQWVDVELIGRSARYNRIQNEYSDTTTVFETDTAPYSKRIRESSVTVFETDTDKREDLKNNKNITSPDRGGLVFDGSEQHDEEALKILDHFYSERERLGLVSVKPKLRCEGAKEVRAIARLCNVEISALEAIFSWIADHEFWAVQTLSIMSLRNKKKGEPPKILKILAQYQSSQRASAKEDIVLEQDAQEKLGEYAGHFSGRSGQISLGQQKRFWKWCHNNGCLSAGASVIKDKLGSGFNAFIGSRDAQKDFIDALILQVENKKKQGKTLTVREIEPEVDDGPKLTREERIAALMKAKEALRK
jgi:hypothetical protein